MNKLESTYNRSIKIMFDLPWATHRYLMEPLTGLSHVRKRLIQRYLSFIDKIQNSKKGALAALLNIVKTDTRTTTGSNLRWIMLKASKNNIEELLKNKVAIDYHEMPQEESWRTDFVKEIIDIKNEELVVPGFDEAQIEEILEHLCTS